ncbi:TetR/AcrR family transcriptional regulator [Exilibacterium tricleocarpae]|uniref:TetR/AcrR family transcriptional regulator n=2 Tax=Exilibacterium tricleocarpae TaxID=2591008 RepID=A0A545TM71_9GAMM|nr:TetR/AcrR family transcriptional regulator [Exilibacterium tricleocarpae]
MAMIREAGIDGLSMRRLADRVGVSRTAPYHHFADKHSLLCALAEEGFQRQARQRMFTDDSLAFEERFSRFVSGYIRFAMENPQYYDLMFGRDIWKAGQPTESLKREAYGSFRRYAGLIGDWQRDGLLPDDMDAVRFAQVSWSMLHGLSRLLIDGIYVDSEAMEGMCQMAARVLLSNFNRR